MKTAGKYSRICLIALVLASFLCFPAKQCRAAEQKTLRVLITPSEGYAMEGKDGRYHGIIVDFLDEIAKYTGWNYEYIEADQTAGEDGLEQAEFDLMGGMYYAEEMEEAFDYPDYNCGYSRLLLLANRNDGSVKNYDYATFNGKTIGVYENATEAIRILEEYLRIHQINSTLKYYTYQEITEAGGLKNFLRKGDVDMMLGNQADFDDDFYVAAFFDSQAHYIVTPKGNKEILDGLNLALKKIYDSDPDFAQKARENYFPEVRLGFATLTEEERAYVSRKRTVTVAVAAECHPLFCLNIDDSHDGYIPDILRVISEYSGLQFSYIQCESYAESLQMVEDGQADMAGVYIDSDETAMERGLVKTCAYCSLPPTLVRYKGANYPAPGLKGALIDGCEEPENVMAETYSYYLTMEDALSAVNRGKIDFVYGLASYMEYVMQRKNYSNIVQVNLNGRDMEIGCALKGPADQELLSIFNKAVNNLTQDQREDIEKRNTISIGASGVSLSNFAHANPFFFLCVVAVFALLIIIIVIQISKYRVRAAVMDMDLRRVEAENQAKSEFLSRMSHEIRTPMNAIVGLTDLTMMVDSLPDKAYDNLQKIKTSSKYLLELINDVLDVSRIENNKMEIAEEAFSVNKLLEGVEAIMKAEAVIRKIDFRLEQDISFDIVVGDGIRLRQVILNLLSNAFKFTPAGGSVLLKAADKEFEGASLFSVEVSDTGIGIAQEDQARIFRSFEQVGSNSARSQGTGLGLAISRHIVMLMGGELKLKSEPEAGSTFYFSIVLKRGSITETTEKYEGSGTDFRGFHILLAEDNELNAEIAADILGMWGIEVTEARNGREAYHIFQNSSAGGFQAVLMDIRMPEMDGLEAARSIREGGHPDAATVPIIAMTANAFAEDRREAEEAGMTGFITKPIDIKMLEQVLMETVKKQENGEKTENDGNWKKIDETTKL